MFGEPSSFYFAAAGATFGNKETLGHPMTRQAPTAVPVTEIPVPKSSALLSSQMLGWEAQKRGDGPGMSRQSLRRKTRKGIEKK